MTEAQKILQMIEGVDPNDTDTLDEIDCRVHCFIEMYEHDYVFKKMWGKRNYQYTYRGGSRDSQYGNFPTHNVPYYTRSRDALKAIRPDGWFFSTIYPADFTDVWCRAENGIHLLKSGYRPTEELAELHAIIQAVEWESNQ